MATGIIAAAKFFWTVSQRVGPGGANKLEDVQLVQLGYACMAANTKFPPPAGLQPIFAKVVPGTTYNGDPSDPLSVAIRKHEQIHKGTQDGVVSPMHGSTGTYGPGISFLMVSLSNNMADVIGASYPFLDAHPKCPPELKAVVDTMFRFAAK